MKFGKRLTAESARRWQQSYLGYRLLKEAIKQDVAARDPRGPRFEQALRQELQKVAAFYVEKEEELAAAMGRLSLGSSPQEVAALRAELLHLTKYISLNYIAVVKAAKKRNRHLRAACSEGAVVPLRALSILRSARWFTSPRLAELSTQAEVLAQELTPSRPSAGEVLAEYQCPICLDILRSPVVLTCAHRFCWGCLLAQCTAVKNRGAHGDWPPAGKDAKQQAQQEQTRTQQLVVAGSSTAAQHEQQQQQVQEQEQQHEQQRAVWEAAEHADDETHAVVCSFDCAVCRKAQLLNLDRLQVDPHLDAFLQKLERQQQRGGITLLASSTTTSTTSQPIPIAASGAAAAAAAAAGSAEGMAVDLKPPSSTATASLAEASEAAEEQQQAAAAVAAAVEEAQDAQQQQQQAELVVVEGLAGEPALLPPQRPEHRGRLVVCLDLDGTLVTTFTPKRAPLLPPTAVSYIVGRGGKLNPGGVYVVERPGLGEFLRRITPFSEVVLFTAGLEDYAAPICDAIEARYGPFHHRLYRPATVASDVYPCIKDMSRLGRDLHRCVLVDDTPLAFFRQPDHGIPVLQFRGDVDDRMLVEAVAPLLESLAGAADVAVPLARRFDMQRWFQAQGLVPPRRPAAAMHRNASSPQLKLASSAAALRAPTSLAPAGQLRPDASSAETLRHRASAGTLLVFDFDHTLTPWDAGERLCDELAPELTSLLSSLQMPANFVPVTNTVLSEMHRRGVSRDALVTCLREMGRELPLASTRMLQWAAGRGLPTVVLSDCNSTFITHILTGAKVLDCVRQIITNPASFARMPLPPAAPQEASEAAAPATPTPQQQQPANGLGSGWAFFRPSSAGRGNTSSGSGKPPRPTATSSHRLVVQPWHDEKACGGPHGCPLCPGNLCKGRELAALRRATPYRRIVYCGDGANDLCPALQLGKDDVVLARAGHALPALIAQRAATPESSGVPRVQAAVYEWRDHAELARLVQLYAS